MCKRYVYALVDPRNDEVRYVGVSIHPEIRYRQHIVDKKYNPHKRYWIAKLKKSRQRPILEILEEVGEDDWKEAEIEWIRNLKEDGHRLVNATLGGDGVVGLSAEVEKERLRKSYKTLMSRPESRKRIAAAAKGNKYFLGYKHTKAARAAISEANSCPKSIEHKRKIQDSVKKWFVSNEGKKYSRSISARQLGEDNHFAKLSRDDVIVIKELLSQRNGMKQVDIACAFHVHPMTISDIKRGKTWSHVCIE